MLCCSEADGGRLEEMSSPDGLPIVLPTAERVYALLDGCDGEAVIGEVPPRDGKATLKKLAACAVMAGVSTAAQFRVVVSAVKATLSEDFNSHGVNATTMGATPVTCAHGRARVDAGINCGLGCLGSGTRANASIGRAVKFATYLIGGATLGGTESTTIGTAAKFGSCFGENEEVLAGTSWTPYSAESSVTVFPATSFMHVVDFDRTDPALLANDLASALVFGCWGGRFPAMSSVLVVVSPEHFELLRKKYSSRSALQKTLFHLANRKCAFSACYDVASAVVVKRVTLLKLLDVFNIITFIVGTWLGVLCWLGTFVGVALIPKFETKDSVHLVVAGGAAGKFSQVIAGFGAGFKGMSAYRLSVPKTEKVFKDLKAAYPPGGGVGGGGSLATKEKKAPGDLVDPREGDLCSGSAAAADLGGGQKKKPLTKLGLLDISKGGSRDFLDGVAALAKNCEVARFRKPTFGRRAPAALIDAIVEAGVSHVVLGLAD
mmetsp:Transcript_2238/g.7482  ORF Transcript_2238/g.7482 Transcript_2238/m.7482 type:complete len:490 (-) Transcript_2238:770-2239(-)